ncbi:MAG TPA: hypothetical protein VFB81_14215, partial [Myxococcales bacterium]|nr:hypothetical protein [Myxococcales bacterium]
MSGTLLVPVAVGARVVTAPSVSAPPLRAQAPTVLEKGVHVHWALPDALTRAEVIDRNGKRSLVFPAVPDLWLVVRWNPVGGTTARATTTATTTAAQPVAAHPATGVTVQPIQLGNINVVLSGLRLMAADRPWRGWVVESRGRRRANLAGWKPPADYQGALVLTSVGLLPSADSVGRPGWGLAPDDSAAAEAQKLDLAQSSYYPESRNLFGLHDPLDDLKVADGAVTYAVIGWYRFAENDPVGRALDRQALLDSWKLDWQPAYCPIQHDFVPAVKSGASSGVLSGTRQVAEGRPGVVRATTSAAALTPRIARSGKVRASVGDLVKAVNGADVAGAVIDASRGRGLQRSGPDHVVCHGSVLQVDLTPAPRAVDKGKWSVAVVPTLQKAYAQVAAGKGSPAFKAAIEAMILDADQKVQTSAGLVGLPNDVHALGFQGRPGKSTHYAELSIHEPARRAGPDIGAVLRAGAGSHWPARQRVRATAAEAVVLRKVPAGISLRPRQPPPPPTEAEVQAFMTSVANAIKAINADGGKPVHSTFLRVTDHRAKPPSYATVGAAHAPHGRTWWVDITSAAAMRDLLVATTEAGVTLPKRSTVWKVPGPRWYRPWSPHLVLMNTGRSYRHGFDGRFDPDGYLACRMDGFTVSSINTTVSDKTPDPVPGSALLGQTASLAVDGIPVVARGLLEEAMLLDPGNVADMAGTWLRNFKRDYPSAAAPTQADVEKQLRLQLQGNILRRDPSLTFDQLDTLETAQQFAGVVPGPVAFMPWQQPWDPLFANVTYTYQPAAEGALGPVDAAIGAPQGPAIAGVEERRLLAASVTKVLDSAMISKMVADQYGELILANKPRPDKLPADTFLRMDVLSTALAGVDDALFAKGVRLRAGSLRIDKVEVVSEMGGVETVTAPPPPLPAGSPWQTDLLPRIPSWGRVQLRLMSARPETPEKEADFTDPPVCGFMIPDLLEHTLEVYDASGEALGQIVSEPPAEHTAATVDTAPTPHVAKVPAPAVHFEAHPWRFGAVADPLSVIANSYLRSFVSGICNAARTESNPSPGDLRESALTAMLRVFDTLRATVDPTDKQGEKLVRLIGAPLALVRGRMWFERTSAALPSGDPPLLADPLTIPAKVGTATQPDDGVLGCFIPATTPGGADAHFRAVDAGALKGTLVNALADAVGTQSIKGCDVHHTF